MNEEIITEEMKEVRELILEFMKIADKHHIKEFNLPQEIVAIGFPLKQTENK
jgi:hypothetical protein